MANKNHYIDPDDFFSDTRMTFGEHIEDLRTHLLRALKGFLLCVIVSFFFGGFVLDFIKAPVERQLQSYWERYYYTKVLELRGKDASFSRSMPMPIHVPTLKKVLGLPPDPEVLFNPVPKF